MLQRLYLGLRALLALLVMVRFVPPQQVVRVEWELGLVGLGLPVREELAEG